MLLKLIGFAGNTEHLLVNILPKHHIPIQVSSSYRSIVVITLDLPNSFQNLVLPLKKCDNLN